MTSLHLAAELAQAEQGLAIVSTLRADHSIQSTLVNAGILDHPGTGRSAVAFVTAGPVKRAHLRDRPQITVTFRNGWQWASVEGLAVLAGPDDPQPWLSLASGHLYRRRWSARRLGRVRCRHGPRAPTRSAHRPTTGL
jgi:hypothetical protein